MRHWIRKHLLTILMAAGLVVGAGLLAYPTIANYWNSFHQTQAIMSYTEAVSTMSAEDYEKILDQAKAYNKRLGQTGIRWTLTEEQKKEYERMLAIDGSGVMGYISIPKIHVKLPIYHGTEESILQTSIGHIEQTSLPVGGKSSHCSVSGHRGLPSARLFTDLDMIAEGDTWTMTVLNETLTYEADQIRIVEPTDVSTLNITQGKDQCTLITCTPYGINTHRLLIRGHRIPNADGDARLTADAIQIEPIYIAPFLAVPILLALLAVLLITSRRTRRPGSEDIAAQYLKAKGIKGNQEGIRR